MKKISLLLTCALVMALAVPAFAAVDNVKITGEVETVFEIGNYGGDSDAVTAQLWADDDVLDLDLDDGDDTDDDMPAERAFYQNIDFNIAGNLNNINFNLAVDTIANSFADTTGAYGHQAEDGEQNIKMDTALLTLSNGFATLKAGDLEDYNADKYFIYDDEDMEGVEVTTAVSDYAVKAFVLGEDASGTENDGSDYYGVTATRNFVNGSFAGKLYHGRSVGIDSDQNSYKVTNVAGALTYDVNELFTVNGEVVFNRSEDQADETENDSLFNLGAKYKATDVVTVRGMFERVGENFVAPLNDLEEDADYDLFNIGGDFAVNANNTLKADYTVVDHADNDKKKNKFELGWDNVNGAFTNTASVEFTTNDDYDEDTDVTVFTLGTAYAMSDVTTVTGKLVNKSSDKGYDVDYTYLAAGLNQKISDNISWDTEAKYITGNDASEDIDGKGNSLKTKLVVSF